jgi:hypothetical protein
MMSRKSAVGCSRWNTTVVASGAVTPEMSWPLMKLAMAAAVPGIFDSAVQ